MQNSLVTVRLVEAVEHELDASDGVGEGARDAEDEPPVLRVVV